MFEDIYKLSVKFFSHHPVLNSLAHSAGGFGLALLLQQMIKGDAIISPGISLLLIAFSVVIHVWSFVKK